MTARCPPGPRRRSAAANCLADAEVVDDEERPDGEIRDIGHGRPASIDLTKVSSVTGSVTVRSECDDQDTTGRDPIVEALSSVACGV